MGMPRPKKQGGPWRTAQEGRPGSEWSPAITRLQIGT
jgi:hypothetical protein